MKEKFEMNDNTIHISTNDIVENLWKVFGIVDGEAGDLSLLNHTYETSAPHISIDYILSNTLVGSDGISRLDDECPYSNECFEIATSGGGYDRDSYLNEERISVRLWYYLIDNIENEFKNFVDRSSDFEFLEKGEIYSKEYIESLINEWWQEFLVLFADYTILSEEEADEICDECVLSDTDIFELCLEFDTVKKITLKDLNSDWNQNTFCIK